MDAVISTSSLVKHYGSHIALRGIDLSVPAGTVMGLIGANGSGKTTTLRLLVDIIRPTSGSIRVLGADPRHAGAALRQRIGYLPGDLRLRGRVRGRTLLRHLAEISGPVAPGRMGELADRLDLDLRRPVHALSKGNRQKLGIVQAFMHDPELLILDEPTDGLDPLMQREFLAMVREASAAGQTVLLSSHVLSEIQRVADRVAVLSGGRIVADGEVASLRLTGIRRVHVGITESDADAVRRVVGALPQLRDVAIHDGSVVRLQAICDGDIDPVIKALASLHVADLTVEEPDLEESVLQLYGADAAAGTAPTAVNPATPPSRNADATRRGTTGRTDA